MKRKIAIFIILILILSIPGNSLRAENAAVDYTLDADKLFALGLFRGTDVGYELEREPTRAEAAVMLIRLLGKEEEILAGSYTHPFTDVPEWADKYIGYMYENSLTKGIGENLYGAQNIIDAKSYTTFVLRALGYSDTEGDFTWTAALQKAVSIRLINNNTANMFQNNLFRRGEMTAVSYNALNTLYKGMNITLAASLVESGSIDSEEAVRQCISLTGEKIYEFLPYLTDGAFWPYLIGLDEETGVIKLRNCGITDISFEYKNDEYSLAGTIIGHNYFPYSDISDGLEAVLTVSKGPAWKYHKVLEDLCDMKKWPEELKPYIIASCKYIAESTELEIGEILVLMNDNINEFKLLSLEESAMVDYGGRYNENGIISISRLSLRVNVVTHEIIHALSDDRNSPKIGLSPYGNLYDKAMEGYTSYISDGIFFFNKGSNTHYTYLDTTFTTVSDFHTCMGPYDQYLELYSALFQIAGKNMIDKMFFGDIQEYNELTLQFDGIYGTGRWDGLMGLGDAFLEHICSPSEMQQQTKISQVTEYYDGILECLEIDYQNSKGGKTGLIAYFDKLTTIKCSIPLDINEYRNRLHEMEVTTANVLDGFGVEVRVADEDSWIFPEFYGLPTEKVWANIINIGAYETGCNTTSGNSDLPKDAVVAVRYKEPDAPASSFIIVTPGMELPLGGEYLLTMPKETNALPGYYIQRDLTEDFRGYRHDAEYPEDSLVKRILGNEDINVVFEYVYVDEILEQNEGYILAQYPLPGSALKSGESTVILTYVIGK